MQIHGYPGQRVDFVSASGSAGSILFGDPRSLVEEFFGPPHTSSVTQVGYFHDAIVLQLDDAAGVTAITITPGVSRERVLVFCGKDRITPETAHELIDVRTDMEGQVESVTFRSR
ncbi:hypothetical protein [Corynebacterium lizhenjunii]|uniref:hypothetical protein n=1 Tax=Corynebacterium lizhenjunii TaxID=2709394 RepID=UPI0013EB3D13|nr:hypothetical protein [Corynebacterium lizhenjunii]